MEKIRLTPINKEPSFRRTQILILGGGFGGVSAARALRQCDADIILVDRRNHHIFQPLLYQVATAVLAPSDVASPLRQLAQTQENLFVLMGEVTDICLADRTLHVAGSELPNRTLHFDYLIVATGVQPSYFGHNHFAAYAPTLKTLTDAEVIRARILSAYELAEQTDDPDERARALTFVLVGAGPTGVELAASIAQMARITLRSNFRRIDPAETVVFLLESGKNILGAFDESLSRKAAQRLVSLGVQVRTGVMVEDVNATGVIVGGQRIESSTVLWTAGVQASPIVKMLDTETDRSGRAIVGPFLNITGHPNVFVVGDASLVLHDKKALPGVAQVAIQQGMYVSQCIIADIRHLPVPSSFRYFDRGNMAVVGKNFAILERGNLRTSGALTWLLWAMLHVIFLPQIQNRVRVKSQWLWSYLSGQRGSRLIPELSADKRPAPMDRRTNSSVDRS